MEKRKGECLLSGIRKTISILNIEDTINKISDSKYGLHWLLIYQDLKTFQKFYISYVKKQIDKKMKLFFSIFFTKR